MIGRGFMHKCVLCASALTGTGIVTCASCGLGQRVPMPKDSHDDMAHFRPYMEQIAVHRKYFRKKIADIQTMHRSSLLDIGCATGVLLEEAEKQGIDAYGVDLSRDAVNYCRKKGLRASVTYPAKRFDAVTAFEVLEHESDPIGFMNRIHKLLKKGGMVILTTPTAKWLSRRHPEHVTFWSTKTLAELMRKTRFTGVVIRPDEPRQFPLSFLFTRSADYFPAFGWLLQPVGMLLKKVPVGNPINPWGDLIVYGRNA